MFEKLKDAAGPSPNPPEKANLFSVDEKSRIQVLDRTPGRHQVGRTEEGLESLHWLVAKTACLCDVVHSFYPWIEHTDGTSLPGRLSVRQRAIILSLALGALVLGTAAAPAATTAHPRPHR